MFNKSQTDLSSYIKKNYKVIVTRPTIFVTLIALILVTACSSTIKQEKEAELNILTNANNFSRQTLDAFHAGTIPANYDIHLFFSFDALNKAVMALDAYEVELPNSQGIKLNIKSMRLSASGSLATVSIVAMARKGNIEADMNLGVLLVPVAGTKNSAAFQMKVLSFNPKISWWIFEFTKIEFVKALLAVELNKLTERLPIINLPVSNQVQYGGAQVTNRQTISTGNNSTLDVDVTIPATLRQQQLVVSNYVFLDSGVHIFGSLK